MPLHPWYALRFQLSFRTKHATEFQDFIAEVFEHRFGGDFFKIKPYGKQGDKKCDGIVKPLRKLLQVYAPQQMKSAETIAKINEDFPGAVKHWDKLFDEWIFVHNQGNGLPPDVAKHLIAMDGKYKKKINQWSEPNIQALVEELSPASMQTVFGTLPDFRNLARVTAEDISVVVTTVAQQPPITEPISTVPSDKLEANALSTDAKELVWAGTQKSRNVGELFERWHDPELGDRVAAAFRNRYAELKNAGKSPDEVFQELWSFAGGGKYLLPSRELATLALLAFLFEQCDIFEAARAAKV